MIQVTPQMRILVAIEPVDFRRGIDGMVRQCRAVLKEQAFSGTVFVFRNKNRSAVKVLVYDGQGFWLCHKRLSVGKFGSWPGEGGRESCTLQAHELQVLLRGGDPGAAKAECVNENETTLTKKLESIGCSDTKVQYF